MKRYIKCEIEITFFCEEDVMGASGVIGKPDIFDDINKSNTTNVGH